MADYQNYPQHLSPYPAHSDMSHEEDYKASYDDLIEEGNTPYTPYSGHQTVAVNTSGMTPSIQRQPSQQMQSNHPSTDGGASTKRIDWGYPPPLATKQEDKKTFWQKWIPDSVPCRLFIAVVLLETLIDLLLEGGLLLQFRKVSEQLPPGSDTSAVSRMPTYLSIFVFAHVFQFAMALDAVYARNTLQFIFLIAFNALFLVYAVIQITEVKESGISDAKEVSQRLPVSLETLTVIIPVVIGLAEAAFIALGWKIYNEFGWKVYKYIGADRRMKKMYTQYQVYQCLVKFDVFFFVGFCVQFIGLVLGRGTKSWEYYLTCAALPLSILLLIEGHLAARHENKWMMATFMSGCVAAMVYFVYKLYRTLETRGSDEFQHIWKTLAIFSVLDILLLIPTFVLACLVMSNFGRGLKEQLAKNMKGAHGRGRSQGGSTGGVPMSANPNRMSID
jgi:hypothetical protein